MSQAPLPKLFGGTGQIVELKWERVIGLDRLYIEGYLLAATSLVDRVAAEPTLLYPVLFLYRHYVEIHLKAMAYGLQTLKQLPAGSKIDHHRIADIWNLVRPAAETQFGSMHAAELEEVGKVVMDIAAFDAGGQEGRYAKTTKGNQSLAALPDELPMSNVKATMAEVSVILFSYTDTLDAILAGEAS
jgi:hypothetical protein